MIQWISPEILAGSASQISTDFLTQNGMMVVNEWYHSPHGIDLFIWRSGSGEILKFQLNLLGSISEWNSQTGIQTGLIIEEDQVVGEVVRNPSFERIFYDSAPVLSSLEYAYQVVSLMKDLDRGEKSKILFELRSFKHPSSWFSFVTKWLKFYFKSN